MHSINSKSELYAELNNYNHLFSPAHATQWEMMASLTEDMIEAESHLGVHPIELIH